MNAGSVTYDLGLNTGAATRALDGFAQKSMGVASKIKNAFSSVSLSGKDSRPDKASNGSRGGILGGSVGFGLGGLRGLLLGGAALGGVMAITKTTAAFEGLQNQINFAAGSAEQGGKDFEYIKQKSNELGLDLLTTAQAYAKLAGATRGTNMEGQKTRDIFEGVSMAGTVLHMTAEQMERSLYAVQQMASKGTVSSEELKQQLGDSLPGAMQIAARAMNMPIAQFNKMLGEGKILSNDFLPKFAKQLKKEFGPGVAQAANSLQANLNRMSSAWDKFKAGIGGDNRSIINKAVLGISKILDYDKIKDTLSGLDTPLAAFGLMLEKLGIGDISVDGVFASIKKFLEESEPGFNALASAIGNVALALKDAFIALNDGESGGNFLGTGKGFGRVASEGGWVLSKIGQAIAGMAGDTYTALFNPSGMRKRAATTTSPFQHLKDILNMDEVLYLEKVKAWEKAHPNGEEPVNKKKIDTSAKAASKALMGAGAASNAESLTNTIRGQRPQNVYVTIGSLSKGDINIHTQTLREAGPEVMAMFEGWFLDVINNSMRYAPIGR